MTINQDIPKVICRFASQKIIILREALVVLTSANFKNNYHETKKHLLSSFIVWSTGSQSTCLLISLKYFTFITWGCGEIGRHHWHKLGQCIQQTQVEGQMLRQSQHAQDNVVGGSSPLTPTKYCLLAVPIRNIYTSESDYLSRYHSFFVLALQNTIL